jgi:hypothetical protein
MVNEIVFIKNNLSIQLTHESQESFKLSAHHGSILILVIQLTQFGVIMVVTGVFGLLGSLVHESNNFVKSAELFSGVISLAVLDANFLDNVHAHSVEDVHEIVHVNFASAIPIIDVANPQNFFSILKKIKISLNSL